MFVGQFVDVGFGLAVEALNAFLILGVGMVVIDCSSSETALISSSESLLMYNKRLLDGVVRG